MQRRFSEKSFYAYKFLSDCLPIYALYTILFREKGLSVTEISLLMSIWSFVTLLLELPSGILADRWNRRRMLTIAMLLKAVCFALWCFADSFLLFAAGFVFWGISGAFTSGTEEGLVYDNLKSESREETFSEIYGKGNFYAALGIVIAIVSSGIIASYFSTSVISFFSAVLCAVNLLFVYRLKEKNYYSERQKEENIGYFKTFFDAYRLTIKNPGILISMILLVMIVSMVDYLDEYDALIIDDFHAGHIWISVILTVRFAFAAFGNRIAPQIEKWLPSKNTAFLLSVAAGLFLLVFSVLWHPFAIPALGISCMLMTIAKVMQINAIQQEIREEGRTTVLSLYSMAQNVVMIVFSLTYALLSGIFPLKMVYIFIAVYCVIGAVCIYTAMLFTKKYRRQ